MILQNISAMYLLSMLVVVIKDRLQESIALPLVFFGPSACNKIKTVSSCCTKQHNFLNLLHDKQVNSMYNIVRTDILCTLNLYSFHLMEQKHFSWIKQLYKISNFFMWIIKNGTTLFLWRYWYKIYCYQVSLSNI